MVSLVFKPWPKFHAEVDPSVLQEYLRLVARDSVNAFKRGANTYKSGRIYRYNGRNVQASGPGEWPAKRSGTLVGSVKAVVLAKEVEIGTNVPYAVFLTDGTRIMAPRKMMKEALEQGMRSAQGRLKNWAKWEMG